MKKTSLLLVLTGLAVVALPVQAVEYRTVDAATVLYDTPSLRGVKLFVIRRDTPVEIVVNLDSWVKVRDADGGIAWIEKKYLANRRAVIVRTDRAEVLKKPEEGAALSFEAEHNVSLDYLETLPSGWIKVRHRDGQEGYVRAGQVWGF